MDNWNYQQLLPGSGSGSNPIAGAVWSDVSCDSNDVTSIINPSYVSHLVYMYKLKGYNTVAWEDGFEQGGPALAH